MCFAHCIQHILGTIPCYSWGPGHCTTIQTLTTSREFLQMWKIPNQRTWQKQQQQQKQGGDSNLQHAMAARLKSSSSSQKHVSQTWEKSVALQFWWQGEGSWIFASTHFDQSWKWWLGLAVNWLFAFWFIFFWTIFLCDFIFNLQGENDFFTMKLWIV